MYRDRVKKYCELIKPYFPKQPITIDWIRTACKRRDYIEPRWMICAMLFEDELSYPQIARAVGYTDHTSVMHAVKKAHEKWGRGLFVNLVGRKRSETPEVPGLRLTFQFDFFRPDGYRIVETINPEADGGWTFTNGIGFHATEPLRAVS